MPAPKDTVIKFLRRHMLELDKPESFALLHIIGADRNGMILRISVPSTYENSGKLIDDWATEIIGAAISDVEAFSKPQQYSVVAFGNSSNEVKGSVRFRLSPSPEAIAAGESESPTTQGALAQAMRLTESFARMQLHSMQSIMSGMASILERQSIKINELEADRDSVWKMHRELSDNIHERQLEAAMLERGEERKDRLIGLATSVIVPQVMKQLQAAKSGDNAPNAPDAPRLMQFVETLSEEQKKAMFESLTPEQLQLLGSIMGGNDE